MLARRLRKMGTMRICDAEGCDRKHDARGLCKVHYRRVKLGISAPPPCSRCGRALRYARLSEPLCRDCYNAPGRRDQRSRPSRRDRARRSITQAATGSAGKRVWTQGKCAWCDTAFTCSRHSLYCSGPCDVRAKRNRRQTREVGGTGWTWSDFMRIARRFGYACAYCNMVPERLDPDHVVPVSRGGDNSTTNLLPSCLICNSDKRDLLLHEWNADRARRGLGPRCTSWTLNDARFSHLTQERMAA